MTHRNPALIALTILLGLVGLCYWPGLSGGFAFDDYWNLVNNVVFKQCEATLDSARQAALSSQSGALRRPVSMFSFWANYCVTELNPFWFKLTNLGIHLLNTFLVFWLSWQLFRTSPFLSRQITVRQALWASLAVAVVWALTPIQLTAVLYVVQRMTSLATTFVLAGICAYLAGRTRAYKRPVSAGALMVAGVGMTLPAVLSKENGILLLPLLAWTEAILLCGGDRRFLRTLSRLWQLALIVLVIAGCALLFIYSGRLLGYEARPFTLGERLMTESRVVWWYVKSIFLPNIRELGLYHDSVRISSGFLAPISTLISIGAWFAAAVAAVAIARRNPLPLFGLGWFAIGHSLESTLLPLELVYEHRNYLPSFGLIFAVAALGLQIPRQWLRLLICATVAYVVLLGAVTTLRAYQWGHPVRLALTEVEHHPNSWRAHNILAHALMVWERDGIEDPVRKTLLTMRVSAHLQQAAELGPRTISPFYIIFMLQSEDGEIHKDAIAEVAERLSRHPIRGETLTTLRAITRETIDGRIKLTEEQLKSLYTAALGQSDLDPRVRGRLLFSLATYYVKAKRDYQTAASLAVAATVSAPHDPDLRIALAKYALALNDLDYAALQVKCANRLDVLGVFTVNRHELRDRIEARGKDIAEVAADANSCASPQR